MAMMELATLDAVDEAPISTTKSRTQAGSFPATGFSPVGTQGPAALTYQPLGSPNQSDFRVVRVKAVVATNLNAGDTVDVVAVYDEDNNPEKARVATLCESAKVVDSVTTDPHDANTVSLLVEKGNVEDILLAQVKGHIQLVRHHVNVRVTQRSLSAPAASMYVYPAPQLANPIKPPVLQYDQAIQITGDVQYVPLAPIRTMANSPQQRQLNKPKSEGQELLEEVREMRKLIQGLREDMQQIRQSTEQRHPSPVRVTVPAMMPGVGRAGDAAWMSYDQKVAQPAQPTIPTTGLNEAHKKIEQALGKEVSLDITDGTLRDAIRSLHESTGVNIVIDASIEDEGVTAQTEVNIQFSGVTMRSALKVLLSPLCLDVMIEDEVLKVTSCDRAKGEQILVVYHVPDVAASQPAKEESFKELVSLITSVIEPEAWREVGGRGTIVGNSATNTIIVRQSKDAHDQISRLLASIWKLQTNGPPEAKPATINYQVVPAKIIRRPQATPSVQPKNGSLPYVPETPQRQPEPIAPASTTKADNESAFQFHIGVQR